MCCLAFEIDNYSIRKNLPEIDSEVQIEGKTFKVKSYDFIKESITFVSDMGEIVTYSFDQLDKLGLYKKAPCEGCGFKNGGKEEVESEGT